MYPPLPSDVVAAWDKGGVHARVERKVDALLESECGHGNWSRSNLGIDVPAPNFDEVARDVIGVGWKNAFALALSRYLAAIDANDGVTPK
jgi:hypothetical protein